MSEYKFSGDVKTALETTTEVLQLVRSGKAHTKHCIDHALFAAGHFHALRPDDAAEPVFGADILAPMTIEDTCYRIEEELPKENGPVLAQAGVDWMTLFSLMMKLVELLRKK